MADYMDLVNQANAGVKAPTSWDRVASTLGGLGSGGGTFSGLGAKIGSIGGPVGTAIGGGIGGAADIVSTIAGLFKPSVAGQQKIDATTQQQQIENAGLDYQSRVEAGTLNPATAIKAIKMLMTLAAGYGSNVYDSRGMNTTMNLLNGVLLNLTEVYNKSLSAPISKEGSLGSTLTDPTQQQDYMKEQLRNKMMGFSAGNEALSGTPMDRLFKPAFDPYSQVPTAMSTARSVIPDYQEPSAFDKIRKRLGVV